MFKKFKVKVNKKSYEVEVEELSSAPKSHVEVTEDKEEQKIKKNTTMVRASAPAQLKSSVLATKEIIAPLPGIIVDVLVKEGSKVKAGDKILVLEAMKMENAIVSPSDSKIDKIHVKKGDSVNGNQLMVTLS
ncbi:MAG TPA: biotin/lipoyl-containing protein [Victivallales bacterium]|nr:biotin/lipoyl-containing protein [Victivallales bacterium]